MVPEADFLLRMMTQLGSHTLPGSEAIIPGLACRFVVRDWRAEPLPLWLERVIAPLGR